MQTSVATRLRLAAGPHPHRKAASLSLVVPLPPSLHHPPHFLGDLHRRSGDCSSRRPVPLQSRRQAYCFDFKQRNTYLSTAPCRIVCIMLAVWCVCWSAADIPCHCALSLICTLVWRWSFSLPALTSVAGLCPFGNHNCWVCCSSCCLALFPVLSADSLPRPLCMFQSIACWFLTSKCSFLYIATLVHVDFITHLLPIS